MQLTIAQILPALESGGVERGTLEIADAIAQRGHRSIVISAGGRMVPDLTARGSEHIRLQVGKKYLPALLCVRRLANIIQERDVDIIHVRSRLPAWVTLFALKLLPNSRRPLLVTTVHGPYSVNRYSRVMLSGDRIIAVSRHIYNYISGNYPGIDMRKVEVIHRGVSRAEFPYNYKPPSEWQEAWHSQHPLPPNQLIVTLPARLTRWKGQEDFIRIIRSAREQNLPVHGLIAGGADLSRHSFERELRSLVRRNNLQDQITFLGHRDDLREIMAMSDIIMSLSREPEAFGRTVIEALSIGKPVIAYRHGGVAETMDEVFPDGTVCPFSTEECVQKIAAFYQQMPVVPDHMPYTLTAMQNKTLALYENAIQTRKNLFPAS